MTSTSVGNLLSRQLVRLKVVAADKGDAIAQAGALLAAAGCVAPAYAESMVRREAAANTFLGHGVAIPHGLAEDRHLVLRNGIAILQLPQGVEWNAGQTARLVVAIAAQSDAHLAVLRRLTRLLQDESRLEALFATEDADDILAALIDDAAPDAKSGPAVDLASKFDWTVSYPSGLHARPASRWVDAARGFSAQIRVRHGDETADAKSLVSLLQLGLTQGAVVTVSSAGPDAAAALDALKRVMDGLSAQEQADAALAARRAETLAPAWSPPGHPAFIAGVAASPGLAIGTLRTITPVTDAIPDRPVPLTEGGALLDGALSTTRFQLRALADDTARRVGAAEADIFRAQAELLNDTDLITITCQLMVEGHGPAWAWNTAVDRVAARLSALGNPVLAARAADLRDVGRRVLTALDPALKRDDLSSLPEGPTVLIAADLSPSDTASLDTDKVVGLVTALGGPTSHTAILARTLGLPAVVAAGSAALDLADGATVIVDGQAGRLYVDPSEADLRAAAAWIEKQQEIRARESEARALPATTQDGHRIEVVANINQSHQATFALSQGAEGVGLMRTEFLFLESDHAPDEDEQYAAYAAMLRAMDGRPVIVRALDIGGDKQVAHLDLPKEENPFLGVRGARLLLRRPELLEPQLRALYRAAADGLGNLSIMFPMITSVSEIQALKTICARIRDEIGAPEVPLGIMIEVPAAAIQARSMAQYVDFFSIGTNDLTQYVLAVDRQNAELAADADALHPAVLRLIHQTVEGARAHGKWVGVCGGLAGDPFGAGLLAGLGVKELSMTPREVPAVKARLRGSSLAALADLAARALEAESASDVRALGGADA
ncbi:phosphoenolpyruvate--protein phosphotransferase [Brevundimonas sp. SORGH_AS_0993]|uniref:phosphoenolpyruvate--protein phosphotransferase n=1 Tax=Brevundimonas sp. SORGH_AS_0993 TaxID=3041794 RepID=UPI00278B91E1|nr:phosphoenolpyruvate--protein phosphotransferase [Brevundimonas sp. SORGH_AS_0993]MDQ1155505.1 phosphoenolpyruvate-protein phosphotransferase [Brevundimonas sp. SORGH_AS_0993]